MAILEQDELKLAFKASVYGHLDKKGQESFLKGLPDLRKKYIERDRLNDVVLTSEALSQIIGANLNG